MVRRHIAATAAHFRYLSKGGRLAFTDDRDTSRHGKDALQGLADPWRFGGERIPEVSHRRVAYNIMLSMPHSLPPPWWRSLRAGIPGRNCTSTGT